MRDIVTLVCKMFISQRMVNVYKRVRGRDMGVEEGTGKEIGGRRNENATMNVRSYEAGQDQK